MWEPDVTKYLNVDLEITSKSDLTSLVTALGPKISVLFLGRVKRTHFANLEVVIRFKQTADETIRAFCDLIEGLPRSKRQIWNSAKRRDFSVGVGAGKAPSALDIAIAEETVKRVAKLNARIVLTVYPCEMRQA